MPQGRLTSVKLGQEILWEYKLDCVHHAIFKVINKIADILTYIIMTNIWESHGHPIMIGFAFNKTAL